MNKLVLTYTGGQRIHREDFSWIQDAWLNGFKAMATAITGTTTPSFILQGCEVTGTGPYNIAAGYVVIEGEVYVVDAHSVTLLAGAQWIVDSTYDAIGNKLFADGLTHDTFNIRKAKVSLALGAGVAYASVLRFPPTLLNTIATYYPWTAPASFQANWANYGAPYNDVQLRMDVATGEVSMRGHAARTPATSLVADTHVFTLPSSSWHPAKKQMLASASIITNFDTQRPVTVIVDTDGKVYVKASAGCNFESGDLSFDGLRYSL